MGAKNNKILVSIVVPCYNESGAILNNISLAKNITSKLPFEFIFVDNGSTDNSSEIFDGVENSLPETIRIHRILKNQGYGFGIKSGISESKGDFIGWTHGDGQTNLLDLERAFDVLQSKPSLGIIKGSRIDRPVLEKITSFGLSVLISSIFFHMFSEVNAQPSIYKRAYLGGYLSYANDLSFDIDAYVIGRLLGAKEQRINVSFPPRTQGVSSWHRGFKSKVFFIARTFFHILKLRLTSIKLLNMRHEI